MKAWIHFAQTEVLFNKRANFLHPEGQKISSEGVRYFEDTNTPAEIKDRIKTIPLVKKLAEDHDVFVCYRSYTYSRLNESQIDVKYADYTKKSQLLMQLKVFQKNLKLLLILHLINYATLKLTE